MTAFQNLLKSYREAAKTEREKGTYFEELTIAYSGEVEHLFRFKLNTDFSTHHVNVFLHTAKLTAPRKKEG